MERSKPKALSTLIGELDTQISTFVRLNAAAPDGKVKCISCDSRLKWNDADCAHYKDRNNMATRFYLPNLAPACHTCNRFDHYGHLLRWRVEMTRDQLQDLELRAKSMMKFTRLQVEEMIIDYKAKVKELKKQKKI